MLVLRLSGIEEAEGLAVSRFAVAGELVRLAGGRAKRLGGGEADLLGDGALDSGTAGWGDAVSWAHPVGGLRLIRLRNRSDVALGGISCCDVGDRSGKRRERLLRGSHNLKAGRVRQLDAGQGLCFEGVGRGSVVGGVQQAVAVYGNVQRCSSAVTMLRRKVTHEVEISYPEGRVKEDCWPDGDTG